MIQFPCIDRINAAAERRFQKRIEERVQIVSDLWHDASRDMPIELFAHYVMAFFEADPDADPDLLHRVSNRIARIADCREREIKVETGAGQ